MGHIPMIEDDALLRDTLLQMLALGGHRVTVAAAGESGLQRFGTSSAPASALTCG